MAYLPPVFFSFSCGRLPSATGGFVYVYYIRNKKIIEFFFLTRRILSIATHVGLIVPAFKIKKYEIKNTTTTIVT